VWHAKPEPAPLAIRGTVFTDKSDERLSSHAPQSWSMSSHVFIALRSCLRQGRFALMGS
jgi:hypothetical protein